MCGCLRGVRGVLCGGAPTGSARTVGGTEGGKVAEWQDGCAREPASKPPEGREAWGQDGARSGRTGPQARQRARCSCGSRGPLGAAEWPTRRLRGRGAADQGERSAMSMP